MPDNQFNFNAIGDSLKAAVAQYFAPEEQQFVSAFILQGLAGTDQSVVGATFMGLLAGDPTVRQILIAQLTAFLAFAKAQQQQVLAGLDAQKAQAEAQIGATISLMDSISTKFDGLT